ncbi:hypothetical protein ACE6H2_001140 [Prunus campanulata]
MSCCNSSRDREDLPLPQNVVKVRIQKDEGCCTVNVRGNEINAPNAEVVGVSDFSNITDHTGQGGERRTAVPKRDYNFEDNKISAQGGKKVGIHNFDNYTLKNSNDEDDAAASGSGDQGHKRAPRSSAPASNKKTSA